MFLELEAFTETTETFSGGMSQFSSRGDQIPGIEDGEFPVVPAKPEEESVEGLSNNSFILKLKCHRKSQIRVE